MLRMDTAQGARAALGRSEEHTSELQSQSNLVCRLLLEKKKKQLLKHGNGQSGGEDPPARNHARVGTRVAAAAGPLPAPAPPQHPRPLPTPHAAARRVLL